MSTVVLLSCSSILVFILMIRRPPISTRTDTLMPDTMLFRSQAVQFQLVAVDPDLDALTYWDDGLPAGASFDPATRIFSWTADYQSAGTYAVRFHVTDGTERGEIVVDMRIAERNEPPRVVVPADRTAREGEPIRFVIRASAASDRPLTFSRPVLPFGATLRSEEHTSELQSLMR